MSEKLVKGVIYDIDVKEEAKKYIDDDSINNDKLFQQNFVIPKKAICESLSAELGRIDIADALLEALWEKNIPIADFEFEDDEECGDYRDLKCSDIIGSAYLEDDDDDLYEEDDDE